MKEFIINFLKEKGVTWIEKDGKILISDEFQKDVYDKENDMTYPYILTEWQHDNILNKELSEFNNVLDEEYGYIFECEWPGTFSIILP